MQENHSAHGRLDSWKEIADYLKRDTRTAIRWEKEKGLPIHRVPGGKRQAVFAYPHEIDTWLGSQAHNGLSHADAGLAQEVAPNGHAVTGHAVNGHAENGHTVNGDTAGGRAVNAGAVIANEEFSGGMRSVRAYLMRRRKVLVGLVCLLGLAGLCVVQVKSQRPYVVRPVSLKQLTYDGRSKAGLRTDGVTLYFNEVEGARGILASAPVSGGPIRLINTPFPNVVLQDLSKDGKTLLVISHEGIVIEGPVWTLPVQGGTPHRVADMQCNSVRWSPDNRRIVCARRTAITVMDADGSNQQVVGYLSSPVTQVAWTPDGTRLRFVLEDVTAHTSAAWEIPVNPDGSAGESHRLPLGTGCCADWAWTQDGKTFIYATPDASTDHLMMRPESVRLSDTRETEVPVELGPIASVTPSKTGKVLYLTAGNNYRSELLKFNAKQGALQTVLPGLSAEYLSFSGDGQWITYINSAGGVGPLWRSRADGSEALQLTKLPMKVEVSSWSPDGRRIAFMGQEPGKPWRIYLVDRDGGALVEAAEGKDNQGGPSWSPDGKTIVYGNVYCEKTEDCSIRRLDLATRRTEIVPESNGFRTARWSPDGKWIAALQFQTRELMLFDVARQHWKTLAGSIGGDNINWSSDSQYIYVDNPRDKKPVVERVRIRDGQRETVISLDSLQEIPGQLSTWFGLTPDSSPILAHIITANEIYELKWSDR
jgi:Tol biopolymer transport system component